MAATTRCSPAAAAPIEVGCWANRRRPLHELLACAPAAREPLVLIQALYRIDDVAKIVAHTTDLDVVAERGRLRVTEAPALLTAIRARTDAIIATKREQSKIAEAASYLCNHRTALTRFVADGRLPLDNNAAKRQERPIALGRKSWLFVVSKDGGTLAADPLTVF